MNDQKTPIIVYGHPTCPGVPPVLGMLKNAGAAYTYINIREDDDARQRVREINDGYESVPTLIFADGSTLTEPGGGDLARKLRAEGYRVGILGYLAGNAWLLITGAIIVYALLSFLEII